ncbi:nucleotidyltransferase family protein [Baekduia soli]|uniref:nucleotidyltransferase family protein n=1 Tax=Baekduia soli TaxID=496014 RepID=UPI001E37D3E9|nr:nucleotidyltransferase family protein [Baekduia soli]
MTRERRAVSGDEPAHRLLRLLCSTQERRAARAEEAGRLAAVVDAPTLAALAARQRLLGIVPGRLREAGLGAPAAELEALLGDVPRHERAEGGRLQLITLGLLLELERHGIAALALKGPLLGEALYGDAGARPSSDVDLLVGRDDLARAVDVVRAHAYRAPEDPPGPDGLPPLHWCLRPAAGSAPNVELHWRVHWHETTFSPQLLAHALPDPAWGRRAPVQWELATLLLIYARDGFAGLRMACDLATLADSDRARALPDGAIASVVDRVPELAGTLAAAALTAERIVGMPAAPWTRRRPRPAPLVTRLADWRLLGDTVQLHAEQRLVDVLVAPRHQRGAALRHQLFPSLEELRWMIGDAAPGPIRRRHQLAHAPSTLLRWMAPLRRGARVSTPRASRSAGSS